MARVLYSSIPPIGVRLWLTLSDTGITWDAELPTEQRDPQSGRGIANGTVLGLELEADAGPARSLVATVTLTNGTVLGSATVDIAPDGATKRSTYTLPQARRFTLAGTWPGTVTLRPA